MTDVKFYEIFDNVNVRIDTKSTTGAKKGHAMNVCDLELQGQPSRSRDFFSTFSISPTFENVRIDSKIEFVSCLQPEIRKVMQNGVWPWFSRSCNEDKIVSLSQLESLLRKHTHEKYFLKNSVRKAKIQRGWYNSTHPLGISGWRNTLGVWGLAHYNELGMKN